MTVVSNSSPLISFAAIGQLDLLKSLYGTIHIPQTVYHEVITQGAGKPGSTDVASATWIQRHTVQNRRAIRTLLTTTNWPKSFRRPS
jgi:hypothetical protein